MSERLETKRCIKALYKNSSHASFSFSFKAHSHQARLRLSTRVDGRRQARCEWVFSVEPTAQLQIFYSPWHGNESSMKYTLKLQ